MKSNQINWDSLKCWAVCYEFQNGELIGPSFLLWFFTDSCGFSGSLERLPRWLVQSVLFCVILVDGEEEQEEEEEGKEDLEGRGCAVPFLSCNGRVCVSAFLCASNFLSLHFANTRPHSSLLPSCFFNSSFFSCFGIVQLVSAKKKKNQPKRISTDEDVFCHTWCKNRKKKNLIFFPSIIPKE